jgi:signal transduction histidine kinase
MKCASLALFFSLIVISALTQDVHDIDSLKHELEIAQNDTLKLLHFILLAEAYEETKPDSSFYYAKNELTLARKLKLRLNEAISLNRIAYAHKNMGNYPASLQTYLSAKQIAEDTKAEENILPDKYFHLEGFIKKPVTAHMIRLQILGLNHFGLSLLYETVNNYDKGLFYGLQAMQNFEEAGNVYNLSLINMVVGWQYLYLKKKDSALIFVQKAYDLSIQTGDKSILGGVLLNLGRIHLAMGNKPLAVEYFRKSLAACQQQVYFRGMVAGNLMLYDVYQKGGKKDSSLYFANTALGVAQYLNSPDLLLRVYTAMAAFYGSSGKYDSTIKYQALIIRINDSLFNSKQTQQFQNIDFDEQQRHQEIEAEKKAYRDRLQIYGLLIGLAIFIIVAIILWQNNRHKQKAYILLKKQKQETDFQKAKVEQTLEELKSTQSQLVQSEKMASLGELTAGIAHEIQNPLNFVNNFSDVNTELIDDMEQEIDKGNFQEVKTIANDIKENQQKINHHGKRADAIVKGMLQHSRSSTNQKEPTDINKLADEYLRLCYHGLRAKDQFFNATMQTDFDESLEKVNIIPQDIGKVLLNLYNNAFYAAPLPPEGGFKNLQYKHEPTVWVSTKKEGDKVLISVKDNGPGIPQKVVDKIFQPFFTTKPTGQGTGLGLSLSYDIIKAHGGEIKVETKEGEGAEFIIWLPR